MTRHEQNICESRMNRLTKKCIAIGANCATFELNTYEVTIYFAVDVHGSWECYDSSDDSYVSGNFILDVGTNTVIYFDGCLHLPTPVISVLLLFYKLDWRIENVVH